MLKITICVTVLSQRLQLYKSWVDIGGYSFQVYVAGPGDVTGSAGSRNTSKEIGKASPLPPIAKSGERGVNSVKGNSVRPIKIPAKVPIVLLMGETAPLIVTKRQGAKI